jgi:hypothetical protein
VHKAKAKPFHKGCSGLILLFAVRRRTEIADYPPPRPIGVTPFHINTRVIIPEALPGIIAGETVTLISPIG